MPSVPAGGIIPVKFVPHCEMVKVNTGVDPLRGQPMYLLGSAAAAIAPNATTPAIPYVTAEGTTQGASTANRIPMWPTRDPNTIWCAKIDTGTSVAALRNYRDEMCDIVPSATGACKLNFDAQVTGQCRIVDVHEQHADATGTSQFYVLFRWSPTARNAR